MPTKSKETKTYEKLCHDVREITKEVRNIDNLVVTKHFQSVWKEASDDDKIKAWKMITSHDKFELHRWVNRHESIELGEKTWDALMHRAKELRVKNYSRCSRLELIQGIKAEEKERANDKV